MLRLLTAGESHGKTLLALIDGFPAGLKIDTEAINRDLVAACKRAKVPRTTPHDLRRTYAHLHYQAGVTLDELESRYIRKVLEMVGGNKSKAARLLGMDRRSLYRRLEKFGSA